MTGDLGTAVPSEVSEFPGRDLPARANPARLRRWGRVALRLGLVIGLGLVVGLAVGRREWARGLVIVRGVGWPILLVLVTPLLALGSDAIGWRHILRNLGVAARWGALTRIRIISETFVLAAPGGSVMAEAAKLTLLRRLCAVETSRAAASLALARALHLAGAGAYLALVGLLAWTLPAGTLGAWRPKVLAFVCGASLLTVSAGRVASTLLRRARLAARLADHLATLPWGRLSRWFTRHRARLEEIDGHTGRYFRAPAFDRSWAAVPFFIQWLIEGGETVLILAWLGAAVSTRGALLVDAIPAFARALFIVLPGGIGVQEGSQVFLLHLLGARDDVATAAALIFIKRTKELFWIVTGASLAAATRKTWPRKM